MPPVLKLTFKFQILTPNEYIIPQKIKTELEQSKTRTTTKTFKKMQLSIFEKKNLHIIGKHHANYLILLDLFQVLFFAGRGLSGSFLLPLKDLENIVI